MAERVVPSPSRDVGVRISGLSELETHLQKVVQDPATPFDVKLLDDVELQLTEENIPPLLPTLLPLLTEILKATTQDPTPLLTLTIKLLSPLSFTRTLTIADPPSLITALRSPLPGANLLALAIIHKAAHAPSDAAILSTLPEVVEEVVRRWLESPDVGVAERAGRVLGDLLETDCEVVEGEGVQGVSSGGFVNGTELVKRRLPGHARLWRLILQERDILSIIPPLCSPVTDESRTSREVSISQGRLLRLLTRLSTLNIRAVSSTPFPDLFPLDSVVAQAAGQGILQWAALAMVDKSDVLMHLNLIDFFETFVSVMRAAGRSSEKDEAVGKLVRTAARNDEQLKEALKTLPDRTIEEEAEVLRRYISDVLGQ